MERWWRAVLVLQMFTSVTKAAPDRPQTSDLKPGLRLSPLGGADEDSPEVKTSMDSDPDQDHGWDSDPDRSWDLDRGWDAWGSWSECSRTCGGGASYSLRRCLDSRNCDGKNIRYRRCSHTDCPPGSGDFRAQQCSAHNDVQVEGVSREWVPAPFNPAAQCALRCQDKDRTVTVELAPKVLDGTRCRDRGLDMCINGVCQAVGCDGELGGLKEDDCGVCGGDGSSCSLVRGQTALRLRPDQPLQTVVEVPVGSRFLRVSAKGPGVMMVSAESSSGLHEEVTLSSSGPLVFGNTSLEVLRGTLRLTLKALTPLGSDFRISLKYGGPEDTMVQFLFYQPIRFQWRETGFFPCSVSCGGGYQLNSAECVDVRLNLTVSEQLCISLKKNNKPAPRVRECGEEECSDSDGVRKETSYEVVQPLPRWAPGPWSRCSVPCGEAGGWQERSVRCVEEEEEDGGRQAPLDDRRCGHAPRLIARQICNAFKCPQWVAMEWSQCTVKCGRGLRYRVVLCVDHRGQHGGGCESALKPHVKETCVVPVACIKPKESVLVEDKEPWTKQAQSLDELHQASHEPTFVVGPWSPCSAPCGPGVQTRALKCQVFLSFTKAEVDLPEEECGAERPQTQRGCSAGACEAQGSEVTHTDPQGSEVTQTDPQTELYMWDHGDFSLCSASCASGKQTAAVRCVSGRHGTQVDPSLCEESNKPPAKTRICNTQPCPPRWEMSAWSSCSASCGVGIQTRGVFCMSLVSVRAGNVGNAATVSDDQCRDFKPSILRPCNQLDCPAHWDTEPWQQCSQTCGGGRQFRKVVCKQLLSSGAYRTLRDSECGATRPDASRSCSNTDCAPYVNGGEWSKCSVSCGLGVQRRDPQCLQLSGSSHLVSLSWDRCSGLSSPPLIRTCRMISCPKQSKAMQPWEPWRVSLRHQQRALSVDCPLLQSRHVIYVQTIAVRRLVLTIGGHSYLLPGTALTVRCPVRDFPKDRIVWYRGRTRLVRSRGLGFGGSGSLRIRALGPDHVGVYTCAAGPTSDTFTVQLIGNWTEAQNRGRSPKPRPTPLWEEVPPSCRSHASLVLPWAPVPVRLLPSSGQEVSLRREAEDRLVNITLRADRNELSQEQAMELIRHILTHTAPSVLWRRTAHGPQADADVMSDVSSSVSEPPSLSSVPHKPEILQELPHTSPSQTLQKNLKIWIGQRGLLTNSTLSVTVYCPTRGNPPPKVVWSKDGALLQRNHRVWWDSEGLNILQPKASDQGLYKCISANEHGSDSESSELLSAEPPSIAVSWRNVSDEGITVSHSCRATVGATVRVKEGTNVTLDCPSAGVPAPSVTWQRRSQSLPRSALPLSSSLWIGHVTLSDGGTYSCIAVNAIGKSTASSILHVYRASSGRGFPAEVLSLRRRLLMASIRGARVYVNPGDTLRIGCPVVPEHTAAVRWSFNNRSLDAGASSAPPPPPHQVLAGGRALEVSTVQTGFSGRYQCETSSGPSRDPLRAWIDVHSQDFVWRLGPWSSCSAPCGPEGRRSRRIRCVSVSGKDVSSSMCRLRPKPLSSASPCNRQDCPPRWVESEWSKCSSSCGVGLKYRQVICQQLDTRGSTRTLPSLTCDEKLRPPHTDNCTAHSCPVWTTSPWGKCSGRCLASSSSSPASSSSTSSAFQKRSVRCQQINGTTDSGCDPNTRPVEVRDCSSDLCRVRWSPGPWSSCGGACGDGGFQTRRVDCVNQRTARTLAHQHCAWIQRPDSRRDCTNDCSSHTDECESGSRLCSAAMKLRFCSSSSFTKHGCCLCSRRSDSP